MSLTCGRILSPMDLPRTEGMATKTKSSNFISEKLIKRPKLDNKLK